MWRLLLLAALLACEPRGSGVRTRPLSPQSGPPGATRGPVAARCAETPFLPAVDPATDVELEVHAFDRWTAGPLHIDGHPTSAPATQDSAIAHRLPDGRLLIDARAHDQLYLWNPTTTRLTGLGRGSTVAVGKLGRLIRLKRSPSSLFDVRPDADQLRELWNVASVVVGDYGGAPLVLHDEMMVSLCATEPVAVPLELPEGVGPVGTDSVRGDLLLVQGWVSSVLFGELGFAMRSWAAQAIARLRAGLGPLSPQSGPHRDSSESRTERC